ncbi:MAG: carbon-nitrogen hydrolase family protein [Candidatus Tectomicrobia bacterium]|nr:carbon-nitrogen hydrolase family protein [Candidatus Tectomicrobia bacterium]
MGDSLGKLRAAAVQAASVYLDREATVEKACHLIRECGAKGADFIVFPESYIPGYPFWVWLLPSFEGMDFAKELYKNALVAGSEATQRLGEAARAARAYVVMGCTERQGTALFNSIFFFNREGELAARRRKLRPTHAEKLVWGDGDGSDLFTVEGDFGIFGGMMCGEHFMDLCRYSLYAMGEQVHAALWPGVSAITHFPRYERYFNDFTEVSSRHHAIAGGVFTVSAYGVADEATVAKLGYADRPEMMRVGGGRSAIFGPSGEVLAGPIEDKEGVIFADLDLEDAISARQIRNAVGDYARPEVLSLHLNPKRQRVLVEEEPPRNPHMLEGNPFLLEEEHGGDE